MEFSSVVSSLKQIATRKHSDLQQLDQHDHQQYPVLLGLEADKPSDPKEHTLYYETDTNTLKRYDGSSYNSVATGDQLPNAIGGGIDIEDLNNTPDNFNGSATQVLSVNQTEDAIETKAIQTKDTTEFTSDGTYNKPSGDFATAQIQLVGGGGGGGAIASDNSAAAGGGGGGGGVIATLPYAILDESLTITVGSGGAGGSSTGGGDSGGNGTKSEVSASFTLTANGGGGGGTNNSFSDNVDVDGSGGGTSTSNTGSFFGVTTESGGRGGGTGNGEPDGVDSDVGGGGGAKDGAGGTDGTPGTSLAFGDGGDPSGDGTPGAISGNGGGGGGTTGTNDNGNANAADGGDGIVRIILV